MENVICYHATLYLMFPGTHYAPNHAGIISRHAGAIAKANVQNSTSTLVQVCSQMHV